MTKAFRNGKKALWLLAGIIAALLLAAALLWWGRPAEARPALADYVGDLNGYETVRVTRQDGQTLTLEEPQAAELKELLDQLSFAGAAEEKTSRANSAPGFEDAVQLRPMCASTSPTGPRSTSPACSRRIIGRRRISSTGSEG